MRLKPLVIQIVYEKSVADARKRLFAVEIY